MLTPMERTINLQKEKVKMNKLAKFIAKDRNAVTMIHNKTGISKFAIYNWANGVSMPRIQSAIKLERATRGAVSVYSWK